MFEHGIVTNLMDELFIMDSCENCCGLLCRERTESTGTFSLNVHNVNTRHVDVHIN